MMSGMGFMTESNILRQAKKGQGETNVRLEALIAAQMETNRLLALLFEATAGRPVPPPQPQAARR